MLALDTSGNTGSIALMQDGRLLYAATFGVEVTHSETLMPEVDHALRFCGKTPGDLSAVLLCNGPGSFTGLRIGLATAKGIAYGLEVPLFVYNSLELNALCRRNCQRNILCVMDAKMQEVYAALYDEHLVEIIAPTVCHPEAIQSWQCGEVYLTGNAAHMVKVPDSIAVPVNEQVAYIPAAGLFALHAVKQNPAEYDFGGLAELEPLYLRESTAQIKKRNTRS